jgi:hypothetical protein
MSPIIMVASLCSSVAMIRGGKAFSGLQASGDTFPNPARPQSAAVRTATKATGYLGLFPTLMMQMFSI